MDKDLKYNLVEKMVIYGLSVLVGAFFTIISIFIMAMISLYIDIPENYSGLFAGISLGVGNFVSGYLSSKKIRSGGILNGSICAVILYVIVVIVSLFVSENGFTHNTLYHFLITLISGMIGGIIGVNGSTRKNII